MPSPRLLLPALVLALAGAAHAATGLAEAKALVDARKLPEARTALTALTAAEPRNAEAFFQLGRAAMLASDPAAAVPALEQAAALEPASSRYLHRLGDAYGMTAQQAGLFSKMGWAKKCRAAYEGAVKLDPRNIDAHTSLMAFYQMAPGMIGGGMDKAYAEAAAIKELDPARGRTAFANLYVADRKFAAAFALYEEVLRETPDDYGSLYSIGRIAAVSGEHLDRGQEALTRCLTLTPPAGAPGPAPVNWRLGNILEKRGDKAAARAAYEAALKADPSFKQARDSLAKL